jgi:recombination associated protein RdgC
MFKNALIYRIEAWEAPGLAEIDQRLQAARFVECGASQPESVGWVEPRGQAHGAMVESIGGQLVLRLATETKAVPGGVIKDQVGKKLDAIEKDTGRRPKGKIVKELKEEVIHALLPRAFPKRSDTVVWIDAQAQWLLVGAGSVKKADAVVTRLVELLGAAGGGLKLGLVQTAVAPATAMATWLAEKEAPAGFAIDRECELKQPDSEKATVRYARHTLDIDEVGEHVRQGKMPTQLALTWAGRVSFVLSEALTLKKIKLLDVVLEGAGVDAGASRQGQGQDEGGFDADVALFTGELRLLIPELMAALGGLQARPAAAPPVALPAATAAGASVAPWDSVAA